MAGCTERESRPPVRERLTKNPAKSSNRRLAGRLDGSPEAVAEDRAKLRRQLVTLDGTSRMLGLLDRTAPRGRLLSAPAVVPRRLPRRPAARRRVVGRARRCRSPGRSGDPDPALAGGAL